MIVFLGSRIVFQSELIRSAISFLFLWLFSDYICLKSEVFFLSTGQNVKVFLKSQYFSSTSREAKSPSAIGPTNPYDNNYPRSLSPKLGLYRIIHLYRWFFFGFNGVKKVRCAVILWWAWLWQRLLICGCITVWWTWLWQRAALQSCRTPLVQHCQWSSSISATKTKVPALLSSATIITGTCTQTNEVHILNDRE